MKKILIIIAVVGLIISLYSCKTLDYPQPAFNKPFSYVIDSNQIRGSFEDFIILRNQSRDSNIKFSVYAHDPHKKTWELVETGTLKGAGDTTRLRNGSLDDIDDYRYFAVEALNKKNYRYEVTKSSNDLVIAVFEK